MSFIPSLPGAAPDNGKPHWLIVKEQDVLVRSNSKDRRIVFEHDPTDLGLTVIHDLYLGLLDNTPCYAVEIAPRKAPKGWRFLPIRMLFEHLTAEQMGMVSRALQLLSWERATRFCGRCATAMVRKTDEVARSCPGCGFVSWPRISPAMIVAVRQGDKLLLAKAASFKRELYSVLAGYVEPGESLEECVRREVREEVGIEVENIRYVTSQSWPFSQSLMVAFTADHKAGELQIDEREILEARWLTAQEIATIPGPMKGSVARFLIDTFLEENG